MNNTNLPNQPDFEDEASVYREDVKLGVSVVGILMGSALVSIGIAGNLFTMLSILAIRSLRRIENTFICSLVFCDLLILVTNYSLRLSVFAHRRWTYGGMACIYTKKQLNVLITCSVMHVFVSAFYRYLKIVHPLKVSTFMKKRVIIGCLIGLYVIPVCAVLGNTNFTASTFILNKDVAFDTKIMFCQDINDYSRNRMKTLVTTLVTGLISMGIVFFYARIAIVCKKAQNALAEHAVATPEENRRIKERIRDFKLMKTMIILMLLYSISYNTLPLMAFVDRDRKLNEWLYLFGVLVFWMSSSINWIFYGFLNRQFKRAYFLFFSKLRLGIIDFMAHGNNTRVGPGTEE